MTPGLHQVLASCHWNGFGKYLPFGQCQSMVGLLRLVTFGLVMRMASLSRTYSSNSNWSNIDLRRSTAKKAISFSRFLDDKNAHCSTAKPLARHSVSPRLISFVVAGSSIGNDVDDITVGCVLSIVALSKRSATPSMFSAILESMTKYRFARPPVHLLAERLHTNPLQQSAFDWHYKHNGIYFLLPCICYCTSTYNLSDSYALPFDLASTQQIKC